MSGPRCPLCRGSGRDPSGGCCEACVGSGRMDPGQATLAVPEAEPRQLGLFPAEVYRPERRFRDAA